MTIKNHLKKALEDVTGAAKDDVAAHDEKDQVAAHDEKAESDIAPDSHVAGSRAGHVDDGDYVGRTAPQFDAEVEQSGAEARSQASRRAT